VRVIIYDEELLVGESVSTLFSQRGHRVIGCPGSINHFKRIAAAGRPDACLVIIKASTSEPPMVREIRELEPTLAIVALGATSDLDALFGALENRADGVCLIEDGFDEIERLMMRCVEGRHGLRRRPSPAWSQSASSFARERNNGCPNGATLTPKERDVLDLLVAGASTARIARQLQIGEATVRTHLQHLFCKFGVHSRLALVAEAVRANIVNVKGGGDSFAEAS
jgi:DNA-binding NarL/FixJ family response regulator